MEGKKTTLQKLKRQEKDNLSLAIRYYSILSAINDLQLTPRQIQLIAFTAIRGNISYPMHKKEFCTLYKSSSQTISNIISELKKLGILVKDASKIKVNPKILLDFNNTLVLETKIEVNG